MNRLNHQDEPFILNTPTLQVRCDPRCGGRISHFVPTSDGHNQFHWDPPRMDPRQLSSIALIGGWSDFLVADGILFPGLHWNQPFDFERLDDEATPTARMTCTAGGLRVVRTIAVEKDTPAVSVAIEYHNLARGPFRNMHIRTQPMLRPGGKRTAQTAVLWPAADALDLLMLADSERGAGRFAAHERIARSNWWGCCDPESGCTIVIEDRGAHSDRQSLFQNTDLLGLENITPAEDLAPGESRQIEIVLRYYPLDIRPWADRLGSSRLLATHEHLVGIKTGGPEMAVAQKAITVETTCIALRDAPPSQGGLLRLVAPDHALLREWPVVLKPGDTERITTATMTLDSGRLPIGDYTLVFVPADSEKGATAGLCVVERTQRQKREVSARKLEERLKQCENRATALDGTSFGGAMIHHDLEAARTFLSAGNLDPARQYLHFVEDALAHVRPDDDPSHPESRDLNVPEDWFQAIQGSVLSLPALSRHPDHYGTFHDNALMDGWHWRDDAQAAYALAWLYVHPSSRYCGDNEAICRAVLAVDELSRNLQGGSLPKDIATDNNTNRFTLCPLGEAMRILVNLPLAPARKAFWRERYCEAAEYQIQTYGGQPIPQEGYLNQDVMYLLIMRFAHELLGDSRYLEQCNYILNMIESQLLPDGAFYYLYPHNEVTTYHEINITYLFRDWMLSGDARCRTLIEKTVDYYPLMVGIDGRVEFSSQTWWKHTRAQWPHRGPVVVAAVTGDGRNQYIASQSRIEPVDSNAFDRLLYAALAARPNVTPETLPEHLLVLDRNVQGPRGRFGRFSWVGTTAPYRDTLVGCMVAETVEERAYAMHYAGPQVLFGDKDEVNPYLSGMGLAMSPKTYERDVAIRDGRAVLGARYALFPYEHNIAADSQSDWMCTQLWYFDEERLLGLMGLTAIRETEARAVDLSVRFTDYDAARDNVTTELRQTGPSAYAAGSLALRVIEHNLDREVVQDTWVCTYSGDTPAKGVYLRSDAVNGRFSEGTAFYLLVEVRPAANMPTSVRRLDEGFGFELATQGRTCLVSARDADGGEAAYKVVCKR